MADTGTPVIVGKPGIATTEFWVVVVTIVGNFVDKILGKHLGIAENAQNIVLFGTAIVASVYSLARAWVKAGTHKAIALAKDAETNRYYTTTLASGALGVIDSVTGQFKLIIDEEKEALKRALDEQKAIGEQAKQDASADLKQAKDVIVPSYT